MEIETTRGRFDVIDEGKGTTLVLVHGTFVDAELRRAEAKELSSRMRVIAPCMRGFGATPAQGKDALTVEDMADDVAAIVAALDLPGPVVIGGLSLGGCVAMAFARKYAEVLRGVIFASTKAEPDDDEARAKRDKAIARVKGGDLAGFVGDLIGATLSPATLADRPDIVAQARKMMMSATPASVASAQAAMRDRPDAMPGLAEISVPALVVVGEDDMVSPLAGAKAMIAAMPETRTQLVIIPKAGHLASLEQPEAFRKAVSGFMATL